MATKLTTSFTGFRERQCTMSLVLDKRSNRKNVKSYPLAARFTVDRKSFYHLVGGSYTETDFSEICNASKSKSPKYEAKKEWMAIIEKYHQLILNLDKGRELTMEAVRTVVEGKTQVDELSFVGVWEEIIRKMLTENDGARYKTALAYKNALDSFKKILWRHPISGFEISIDDLRRWDNGMRNGVKDRKGELVGKLSDTTRGIYLRECRAVWNECVNRGYLANVEYPFSNVKKGYISIPVGETRKDKYLDVERMTQLYHVFVNKEYPETWTPELRMNVNFSLGIFLVQYLCNGFNLADAGLLTYNKYYFDNERKAFKFHRKKTRNNSGNGSEVIVPIIEPLQVILDDIAAEPVLDGLVFPTIIKGAKNEAEFFKRTAQENANVKKRVGRVCQEILGWEVRPSGTWCRHSYATNLTHAGVDRGYISESMGHSHGNSITDRYIANYPLEKQMEYNNKLLDLHPKKTVTKEDLEGMSREEMTALLLEMMNKKNG